LVVAGQRAQVAPAGTAAVRVREVEPEEMSAALAWKVPRFQFFDTPLAVVVAEFNRLNRVRLVLEPRELGRVQIGGTFRVDNVDGFVRLLEATLGIVPVADGDNRIILTRASGD
jgi:transmembrane sensor